MDIKITHISSRFNTVVGKPFIADADRFFKVNKDLHRAQECLSLGWNWEGAKSFGTFIRIEGVK